MLTLQRPSSDLEAADTPRSLVFDRRIGPRPPAGGAVLASVAAGEGLRLVPLQLIDAGRHGLGAISQSRLRAGTRVTLHAVDTPLARDCGVVARCDERPDGGYLVGVAFDSRMAA
jgi:hypothetical protein